MENDSSLSIMAISRVRKRRARTATSIADAAGGERNPPAIRVDPYRNIVFANRIREQRLAKGFAKLFPLASKVSAISYIRMSKLERGEVFARPDELRLVGAVLGVDPLDLLIDVESNNFDISDWYAPFAEGTVSDSEDEAEFALLLAAALRARRLQDDRLTAARMAREYDIPPVILSRLENGVKGVDRWNRHTVLNLCRLFEVEDVKGLKSVILQQYRRNELDVFLQELPDAVTRTKRMRERVAVLRAALSRQEPLQLPPLQSLPLPAPSTGAKAGDGRPLRSVEIFGSPLSDGLIAMTSTGMQIEPPAMAGQRSFGLRVGRATLGGGLPGQATVIVDPDRFPQAGGLALVRERDGYRVLAVAVRKDGQMIGYSVTPEREILLDGLATEDVACIISAIFV